MDKKIIDDVYRVANKHDLEVTRIDDYNNRGRIDIRLEPKEMKDRVNENETKMCEEVPRGGA